MCPACEPNTKLRLTTTLQRLALAIRDESVFKKHPQRQGDWSVVHSGLGPPLGSQRSRGIPPPLPGKRSFCDGWARVAARPESRGQPAAGWTLTSASSLPCGSEGNSSFTSSMVPGPRRVGAVRPSAPPGWRRRQRKEGGRTAGGRAAGSQRALAEHGVRAVATGRRWVGRRAACRHAAAVSLPLVSAPLRQPGSGPGTSP